MQIDNYKKIKRKNSLITIILLLLLILLVVLSLFIGQYGFSFIDIIECLFYGKTKGQITPTLVQNIILNIRVPRTISAVIIGGSLAIAGATYQCVFRNMLVSQDVLGVSTGACVGAALAIVLNLSVYYIQLFSFAAGILTVIIILILSNIFRSDRTLSLILCGILVSGLMSSLLGLIKYMANPETHLQTIVYWIMGDISSINMNQLSYIAIPMALSIFIILIRRWRMNYFSYIDREAKSIGVDLSVDRIIFISCSTIIVSLSVSVSGSIGWIGLVIPQLVRLLVGTDNRNVIPASFLAGSVFLLTVDIINRIVSTAELPVSILTGIIGTPLFVLCLIKKSKGVS